MERSKYTPEQAEEAGRLISAIESVPRCNRPIVSLMTEAFINGMLAQEQLSSAGRAELDSA